MIIVSFTIISLLIYTNSISAQSENQTLTLQSPSVSLQLQNSFCKLTGSDLFGPFYKEGDPFKQTLGKGLEGERLIISGKVMDTSCKPITDDILDVWQTNSTGQYDNEGFTLRGKIKTDNAGNYTINNIFPKEYSTGDITRLGHIHLKGAPNQPTLTTQLYFEGDPYLTERQDKSLILKVTDQNETKKANFDFIVEYYNQYKR